MLDLPSSTRVMASMRVCDTAPDFDRLAVLSWSEDCVTRRCTRYIHLYKLLHLLLHFTCLSTPAPPGVETGN